MNQLQRFDISDFFNEVQAPIFIIDAEGIIFFNQYFKENFLMPENNWKNLFNSDNQLNLLTQFFKNGDSVKSKLLKAIENKDRLLIPHYWEFTSLASDSQKRFLVAKGDRKEVIPEIPEINPISKLGVYPIEEIEYLRTILHNTHDLISILDEEGTY